MVTKQTHSPICDAAPRRVKSRDSTPKAFHHPTQTNNFLHSSTPAIDAIGKFVSGRGEVMTTITAADHIDPDHLIVKSGELLARPARVRFDFISPLQRQIYERSLEAILNVSTPQTR